MARRKRQARPEKLPVEVGVPPEPQGDPYAAYVDREWGFAPSPSPKGEVVNERALHALVRSWRHGRATRTVGQVFSDAYIALFSGVLISAMLINVLVTAQGDAAACITSACRTGRVLVPWGVHFALLTLVFAIARLFGPVLASAAEGFWLLDAPISRALVLRGRLRGIIAGATVAPAALAAGISAVAGEPPVTITAWALAGGAGAGGAVAWAAWEQSFERVRRLRIAQGCSALIAALACGVMVAVAAGVLRFVPPAWLGLVPWGFAVIGMACLGWFAVGARRRLEAFARGRLTSGGSLVTGLQGAMFGLDLGLARDILVDREAIEVGHVRPRTGRGTGVRSFIWRDVQRLARRPRLLFGVVGAIGAPYAADAVGLTLLTPLLAAIALMFALVSVLGMLRVLSRTQGLARAMPFSNGTMRLACFAVAGLLALAWAAASAPAFAGLAGGVPRPVPLAAIVALGCALAGLSGAIRWVSAGPVNFASPMMATSAGALPPALVFNLTRGFDVAALITAPILLNANPLLALGFGGTILLIQRSGLSLEELQADAKEQQERLDAEKAKLRN